MRKKTVIFFELTDYSLLRFPKKISDEYAKNDPEVQFVFIYLYKYSKETVDFISFPKSAYFVNLKGNISGVDAVFLGFPDSIVFIFALRPPEFYLINTSKKLGIDSILLQHGVFIPFMRRNLNFFIKEARKMVFYFKSILSLSSKTKSSPLTCFSEVFSIYILGNKNLGQSIFSNALNVLPGKVYVYSEYWKDYFMTNYGFSSNQFSCIGSPDLEAYGSIINQEKEDAVCYICQTLVEDGRLSKKDFDEFLLAMYNSLEPEQALYLKLHPRSKHELYDQVTKRERTYLIKEKTPNCIKYIGHYSTLVSLALNITGDVFLWEFKNHKIPEYFSNATAFIDNTEDGLRKFIQDKKKTPALREILKYYFHHPGLKPFEEIYKLTEK